MQICANSGKFRVPASRKAMEGLNEPFAGFKQAIAVPLYAGQGKRLCALLKPFQVRDYLKGFVVVDQEFPVPSILLRHFPLEVHEEAARFFLGKEIGNIHGTELPFLSFVGAKVIAPGHPNVSFGLLKPDSRYHLEE
jgi:hypothetical protein